MSKLGHPTNKKGTTVARTAYRWKGDLFCEGDIVDTLLDDEPWSVYLEENQTSGDADRAEQDLTAIADYFGIDRNDKAAVDANGFPVRIKGTPKPPDFCSVCLNWFS